MSSSLRNHIYIYIYMVVLWISKDGLSAKSDTCVHSYSYYDGTMVWWPIIEHVFIKKYWLVNKCFRKKKKKKDLQKEKQR